MEAAGHKAVAPDLPGHGQDTTPIAEVTLDAYVKRACDVAGAQGEPVILVGHSMGGRVITQAAECCPDSIDTLVYLTAALLKNSVSQTPDNPQMTNEQRAALGILSEDGLSRSLRPEVAKDLFYNDCSDEDVERAKSLVCDQAVEPTTRPMQTTDANFGRVPRVFIECLQDNAIPIDAQRKMHQALPCQQVFTMDTSHSPFLSAPEELAGHLLSAAKI